MKILNINNLHDACEDLQDLGNNSLQGLTKKCRKFGGKLTIKKFKSNSDQNRSKRIDRPRESIRSTGGRVGT